MEGEATSYRDSYSPLFPKTHLGLVVIAEIRNAKIRKKCTKKEIALRGRVFSADFLIRDHSLCCENSHLDRPLVISERQNAKMRRKQKKRPFLANFLVATLLSAPKLSFESATSHPLKSQ